jgi:hypothetical protein
MTTTISMRGWSRMWSCMCSVVCFAFIACKWLFSVLSSRSVECETQRELHALRQKGLTFCHNKKKQEKREERGERNFLSPFPNAM